MSLATVRDEVKAIMLAVTGVGTKVYDYDRWTKDWTTFLNLFKTTSLIKGWIITRTKTPEIPFTVGSNLRTHTFLIRGLYSLKDSDATEKTFQDIVEAVATAFRSVPTLNGKAHLVEPLQIDRIGIVTFGGVLCHVCELTLAVQEEEQK